MKEPEKNLLWNRLKNKYKSQLEFSSKEYPNTYQVVVEELKTKTYVGDCTFSCINSLCLHTDTSPADKVWFMFESIKN